MATEKEQKVLDAAKAASEISDPGLVKRAGSATLGFGKWLIRTILLTIVGIIIYAIYLSLT